MQQATARTTTEEQRTSVVMLGGCWMRGVVKGGEGVMNSDGEQLRRRRLWE
jgi:hypothetical protein